MFFAVSTLGCPGRPLPEVAALLGRHGVGFVQLRCAPDEPVHTGIDAAARRQARRVLDEHGLVLSGLATYVYLTEGAAGLREHLDLAHDLGAPALRLMPGGRDDPAPWLGPAAEALAAAQHLAAGSGVRLLVETHDVFLRGADVAALLRAAGASPESGTGAIWDAMHPWRSGEPPHETAAALAPWLAEMQIKDAAAPDALRPLVPGEGAVPLHEILDEAAAVGFDGPVTLEHEARWYADAAPIDAAIAGSLRVLAGRV